jgi:hypothetical protein
VVNLDDLSNTLSRIQDASKQQVPSIGTRLRQIYVQEGVKKALLLKSHMTAA